MRVAVIYNTVANESSPDESDVLIQVAAVKQALRHLGHRVASLACGLNLSAVGSRLGKIRPDVVFNLVESLDGQDRLIHLLPALLDSMGIPYTGSKSEALYFTSNKTLAKQWMVQAQLPTPPWIGPYPPTGPVLDNHLQAAQPADGAQAGRRWLIKSLWQHASSGLHEDELILGDNAGQIQALLPKCAAQFGGACFAEVFIDGREFNLSVLAESGAPRVLPPEEIIFDAYPQDKLHIVGYRAKWEKDSFEYQHTPRSFDFAPQDAELLISLEQLAKRCWQVFGLGGYARVDFRVDAAGQPWILEINTNPCLSPDAGFAAAVGQAGLTFTEAVERILSDAMARKMNPCPDEKLLEENRGRLQAVTYRRQVQHQDAERVRRLVEITGYFSAAEIEVAVELVNEHLLKGAAGSGYYFIFAERYGRLAGYACYGPVPATASSYDLYWIAVHPDFRRRGLGKVLLEQSEHIIRQAGGTRIYVDTSMRAQYEGTRSFYEHCGFQLESVLKDFYAPGEAKAIYCKSI